MTPMVASGASCRPACPQIRTGRGRSLPGRGPAGQEPGGRDAHGSARGALDEGGGGVFPEMEEDADRGGQPLGRVAGWSQ